MKTQKKICMVGVFGTGKTCLVQQYVHTIFSERYHTTVGVKIDRKEVALGDATVAMVLWDLAGRDGHEDITLSYLRGAHGVLYVVDGTRRETFDQVFELRDLVDRTIGPVPSAVALNKADLTESWALGPEDDAALAGREWHRVLTSAKTGQGVEEAFARLARAALQAAGGGE